MNAVHLSRDEIGTLGQEIYQRNLKSKVEAGNIGRYVAIDVHTGQYEIGDEQLDTLKRLHANTPNAEAYLVKIGYSATAVIGGGLRPTISETKQW
jgi:hypothetical protein